MIADCATKPGSIHSDSCSDPFTGSGHCGSGLIHLLARAMIAVAWAIFWVHLLARVIFVAAVAWATYWLCRQATTETRKIQSEQTTYFKDEC